MILELERSILLKPTLVAVQSCMSASRWLHNDANSCDDSTPDFGRHQVAAHGNQASTKNYLPSQEVRPG
jgi:hypothetical protein